MTDRNPRTTHPNRRSMLFGGSALVTAAALMPDACGDRCHGTCATCAGYIGKGQPVAL
jgi:hypothetical protein